MSILIVQKLSTNQTAGTKFNTHEKRLFTGQKNVKLSIKFCKNTKFLSRIV